MNTAPETQTPECAAPPFEPCEPAHLSNLPTPPIPPAKRLFSKIASLPSDLRNLINESLSNGLQYPDIIALLEEKGCPGITKQNLSYWYQTGYQHYLRERDRHQLLKLQSDSALALLRNLGPDRPTNLQEAADILIAASLGQVIQDFDPQHLTALLAEKPEFFFRIGATLSTQARERTRREALRLLQQKHADAKQEKQQAALPKPKGGITPEAIAQIRQAIDLI